MAKCIRIDNSLLIQKALAVIAGVGPGLGKSLALKFASEYKIVLLSRTQEKLDRFAEEIKSQGGDV